jgi:hypothetical protein
VELKIPAWKLIPIAFALWLAFAAPQMQGCSIGGGAPISDTGFRALLTYDEANRSSLSPGQKQIYDSIAIPAYLDAHCVKDKTNTPEWRLWSDAETPKDDQPIWQKLMAIAKGKKQWVVVGDGRSGTSQEWPADEAAMLALLKKFEGT